jgi:uncharacterized protein YndB with AHSA1/START domain
MTTDKARKRAVRDRMAKTGESYTAARRHLAPPGDAPDTLPGAAVLDPEPGAAVLPPRIAEPEVSEEAIVRGTGRGWDDWLRLLDARGIDGFSHRDTAAWLAAEQGLTSWWAQSITIGFERARGLRAAHQLADGFSVGVAKTFGVPVEWLWAAFADEAGRSRWLEPGLLRERTAQPGRSARFDVAGGPSRVAVSLASKGEAKTAVTVQHERLAAAADVEERRAFWKERLAALADLLAAESAPRQTGPGAARPAGAETAAIATAAAPPAASPLEEYVAGVDPAKAGLVVELDRLVRGAAPELDVAVRYRMLTYALDANWWRWVAAISVTKHAVNLRLLYGTRLASGVGVLRPGSSHLANLDLVPGAPVDADLVAGLVREAVARHPEFLASEAGAAS